MMPNIASSKKKNANDRPNLYKSSIYLFTSFLLAMFILYIMLTAAGAVNINNANIALTLLFELLLPFSVFSYMSSRGMSIRGIIENLGLSKSKFSSKALMIGLGIFALYIIIVIAIGLYASVSGTQINSNVESVIGSMPLFMVVFAALIAPFCEEIMFRGFMVPRIGIVISALIFAALHGGYMSYIELFMALWFGLIAGYVFKKQRSLYATILPHILVNSTTAILLLHSGIVPL